MNGAGPAAPEPGRVAIIDLGSNTARLVALEYRPHHSYRLLDELRQVVRLPEGAAPGSPLRPAAARRGLQALAMFSAYCRAAGISDVVATATSAIRDAADRAEFVAAARAEAGLDLRVLGGEEEAVHGLLAVANSFACEDALVLDVGGGSAQLSLMQGRRFVRGRSFPLGAVRTAEAFFAADPPTKASVRAAAAHARESAAEFLRSVPPGLPLIGLGGTVRNLADVRQQQESYPLDLLHGYVLSADALAEVTAQLLELPLAERRALPGLNADRADIMPAGAVVVRELLGEYGASELLVSGQGLREGLFYPRLFPGPGGHLAANVREFSVLNLMRHYPGDERHNRHVQRLALALFDQTRDLHRYGSWERELLGAAALLHDIGMAINYYEHHKHSSFLILGSGLPGFDHRELALISLLARYHRKGRPSPQRLAPLLGRGDVRRLALLTGMLRLAEYLERSKAQRVTDLRCRLEDGVLRIEALTTGDAQVEVREAHARRDLLAGALGLEVEVTGRDGG